MTMDYEKAASFWDEQAKGAAVMERDALERVADAFLTSHNTCALATGWDGFVRCTPLEYTWWNSRFWFLSEGGHKFAALAHNQNVSLAVFEPYEGFGRLAGVQVAGRASLIEPWSEDYMALLAHKNIPEAPLRQLDHPMHLLCVTPTHMDILFSTLKAQGFSARQTLDF